MQLAFVTNNASRTPEKVAAKLTSWGSRPTAADVVTSAQAAARVLVKELGAGARVLLLGGEGLEAALGGGGLVRGGDPSGAVAVVSGYGPDVLWRDIMRVGHAGPRRAALRRQQHRPDHPDGLRPGARARRAGADDVRFAGVEPIVAGKPEKPLMEETVRRVGGDRPIMVGDRLDTDIEGAHAIGRTRCWC